MKNWLILLATLFGSPFLAVAQAADLIVYTEDYPPYNYTDTDGRVAGLATEKVRQVLDASGLGYTIKLVPWSRAMLYATTQENAFIYTITRTPAREVQFDWLVPLADSNFYLYARADEYRLVTSEAVRAGVFTAACVSGDLTCDLLSWTGIPEKNVTQISDSETGDFRMVVAGRADLYISDTAVNHRLRQAEGFRPDVTRPTLRIGGKVGFYLASGLQVPEELRHKVRESYQHLHNNGLYELVEASQTRD
ncbi:substrate-binding periplasmic protein [Kordiimonas aestuarii]|uniref:substrate-binding periplasmic protein n=1 Tax=Kordiimonas aestuarii TaxID=1005925 RepID=UPI0021D3EA64|nr:transporter substrate-binding domain-containing protein [Kordiimonas aestuarii]